jgi:uncharacterized membrane protein
MNLIAYILKANLFLVIFYGFYFVFFRKETFHKANRYFLVVGAILALVLPFVRSSQMQKTEIISSEIQAVAYDLYFQSDEVIAGPVVETYSYLVISVQNKENYFVVKIKQKHQRNGFFFSW